MDYSKLILKIREELLLSQKELAEKMNVSFATINRWENGHHDPTILSKRRIQKFCYSNGLKKTYDSLTKK